MAQEAPPAAQAIADALAEFARNPITLTAVALAEVQMLIRREKLGRDVKLRVGFEEGNYALDLTEEKVHPTNDLLYDFQGLAIVVNQNAAAHLANLEIDMKSAGTGRGKGFVFTKRR
jgi:Fe-S cluster assembly iron-binding protein IscA